MIVSASRRTDLPAFFSTWFMNRVRAGWCAVPNPFNARQVSRISLAPEDVDAFVFWTRFARPLTPHLPELDDQGYPYVFQYTIVDYPRSFDRCSPPLARRIDALKELAARIGPERITWRYDPIVISSDCPMEYHHERFAWLARELEGCASRCVISFMEFYAKVVRRMAPLGSHAPLDPEDEDKARCAGGMADMARERGMELATCCQPWRERLPVVRGSACIDGQLLARLFGIALPPGRDGGQRPLCNCAPSRDIGMYDSCRFGCRYCYATASRKAASRNRPRHDPDSPSMLGNHAPVLAGGWATLPGLGPKG